MGVRKNKIDMLTRSDAEMFELEESEIQNKISEILMIAGELNWTVAVSNEKDSIVMGPMQCVDDVLDGLSDGEFNVYVRDDEKSRHKYLQ